MGFLFFDNFDTTRDSGHEALGREALSEAWEVGTILGKSSLFFVY